MKALFIAIVICFLGIAVSGAHAEVYTIFDLTELASHWLVSDCKLQRDCSGLDLDLSGQIDYFDFSFMAADWGVCADDIDCDGLSDSEEATYDTKSNNRDTDNDWVNDGDEVYIYFTEPNDPDTDGDGLLDGEEVNYNSRTDTTIKTLKNSSGSSITSLTFSNGGTQTVYVDIPVWNDALEYIAESRLTLSGQAYNGSYPSDVLIDVGGDWAGLGLFDSEMLDWEKPLIRMDNEARGSAAAMLGDDGIGQSFQVLKNTEVRGFAVLMEFFLTGDYYYGLQDASGNWLTNFPQTYTVSAATGMIDLIHFPFPNNVSLTRGTDYILAVVEQSDLGDFPLGFIELVDNPYPYGRMFLGANHADSGGWDANFSSADYDLAFHLYSDFDGTETTHDLSAGFNLYLASHTDANDGSLDGYVRVPIDIHSATAGTINFSNITIELAIVTTDPNNSDTDGDGLRDGWDDVDGDQIYDADETEGEKQYATDPNKADTDGDGKGLNDYEEINSSYDMTLPTGSSSWHFANPLRPDLMVEVDSMAGYQPNDKMMFETQKAYEELGINLRYKFSNLAITPASVNTDAQEESQLSSSDSYNKYTHLFFARDRSSGSHGTTHYALPNTTTGSVTHFNNPHPKYAGTFVFQKEINDDYTTYKTDFQNVGITLDLLTARTIIHELGHIVGCMHEGSGDGWDNSNVMITNGNLGSPSSYLSRWELNVLGPGGNGPRFSKASGEQVDMSFKPSVETGLDPKNRRFDFGTPTSAIYQGNLQVLITDNYDSAVRYGWDPNAAPDSNSENGGASSDDLYDIVEQSTDGSPTKFRVGGLGQAELTVRVYMGKGRLTSLTTDIVVHARVLGRVSTNFESTTINSPVDSDNLYLDWPNYPVPFRDGSVIIDFTDDASTAPAPIEYLRVTKRDV